MSEKKIDWVKVHKQEVVDFVSKFYRTSWDWRSQAYHTKWDRWERNYNNIYDPDIKNKKETWQATMFVPMTVTHVETIYTGLIKILLGRKRYLALEPRESGDLLQAELNTELLDYELEKSKFPIEYGKAMKDGCIFGDGFLKCYWEKKTAPRRLREPVRVGMLEGMMSMQMPGTIKGEKEVVQDVLVKDNIRWEYIPIRDIFLEPNMVSLDKVLHRQKVTYGELKRFADQGMYDKESVKELWMVKESDKFESDLSVFLYELGITDPELPRPSYDQRHSVFEYWGVLPRKWVDLGMPENTEKEQEAANELVPGKAVIASGKYYLGSEINPNQSMEPPFVRVPYIISGRTYNIGVAQLLEGLQEENNEIRNQRVDNVNLAMNKMFAVIEKYVVDPKEIRSAPFGVIRFKEGAATILGDIKKAIMEIPVSEIAISAYRETGEIERQAQEVTGANKVTIGTAGQTKDTNQTLGGMELLQQAYFSRITIYAYMVGCMSLVDVGQKTIEMIYQNSSIDRLKRILGQQPIEILPGEIIPKWAALKMIPPHELVLDYDIKVVDVFSMENKAQKRQSLAGNLQLTASIIPQFDPRPGLKKLYALDEFTADEIEQILSGIMGPTPTPLGMGQGVPSLAKPVKTGVGDSVPSQTPTQPTLGL